MRLRASVVFVLAFVLWGVIAPTSMASVFKTALAGVTTNFGWLYLWVVLGLVVLAFSPSGNLKLGGDALHLLPLGPAPVGGLQHRRSLDRLLPAAPRGIGALQIGSGLHQVFGLPTGVVSQIGIIVAATLMFIGSAVSGVDRGVKWLSSANLMVALALALVVFVLGPTVALIDTFSTTLGAYLSEFVRMSLRTTPFTDSSWVGDWTVFYWAWWISWSPFVGLFIARVSRGRTIRQFVLGTVLAPTLAAALWFSIFGGTALWLEIFKGVPLAAAASADVSTVLFHMFNALPLSMLMSAVATVLMAIALWRGVREDWAAEQERERALRRKLRALANQQK